MLPLDMELKRRFLLSKNYLFLIFLSKFLDCGCREISMELIGMMLHRYKRDIKLVYIRNNFRHCPGKCKPKMLRITRRNRWRRISAVTMKSRMNGIYVLCVMYTIDQSRQKFVTLTRIFCVLTRNCRPSRDKSNVQSRKILTDNFRYSFL